MNSELDQVGWWDEVICREFEAWLDETLRDATADLDIEEASRIYWERRGMEELGEFD